MMPKRICSVSGCGKPYYSLGFCAFHYKRHKAGQPLNAPHRTFNGEAVAFLAVAAAYQGDDCLIWPYSRDKEGGHATVCIGKVDGKKRHGPAAREVCKLVHGEPPTPRHQAAHSCGKNHEGCVSGKHLRWATPKENSEDKKLHGTHRKGSQVPTSRLSDNDARCVLVAYEYMGARALAEWYGVTQGSITNITSGRRWAWLRDEI